MNCRFHTGWPRPRFWKRIFGPVLVVILYICYYNIFNNIPEMVLPSDVNFNDFGPFEPQVIGEFPQGRPGDLKIPRILHQTYPHTRIPPCFQDNVRKLIQDNPGWTYYLWTDDASRQYVADTHPELLQTFDSYKDPVRRADFIRYVALFEMGGVYADIDTISYRSLDVAITRYTCIFPLEPFEHAAFLAFVPYMVNNAIMICKPKHPFLKHILESLPRFEGMAHLFDSTGPRFVTTMYMEYNKLGREVTSNKRNVTVSSSPYFYKGNLTEDDDNAVYIPNTQYFLHNVDSGIGYRLLVYRKCKNFKQLNHLQQRGCVQLKKLGLARKPNRYAILEHEYYHTHVWYHYYNKVALYLYLFAIDIGDLVPKVRIYSGEEDKQ